jgi:hypothetical protein
MFVQFRPLPAGIKPAGKDNADPHYHGGYADGGEPAMIETQGTYLREKNLLRFVCPVCGRFEERSAPHRISSGSTLKTVCQEKKHSVLVVVERCV